MNRNPIQPLVMDDSGVLRFKVNAVVRYLLNNGGLNMNDLAEIPFSNDDREQFAQLIGYSLGGFADLSYTTEAVYETAELMFKNGLDEKDARIAYLEEELSAIKIGLREPIARLYATCPEDLCNDDGSETEGW